MGIALVVCTLIALGGVGFFVYREFGRRSKVASFNNQGIPASPADTPQTAPPLPQVGATVTGNFFYQNEQIHALCRVESRDAYSVGLKIVTEVGKVSLKGVRPEANGQLTLSDMLVPFRVTQVDFPVVIIEIDPENARPANRQVFRLSPDFSVRFRPKGVGGGWFEGKGIDLGQEGLSLCVPGRVACRPEQQCEIELTVRSSRSPSHPSHIAHIALEGEVRWIKPMDDGTAIGINIADRKQHQELVELVFHLQHRLSRRPKDYLTEISAISE